MAVTALDNLVRDDGENLLRQEIARHLSSGQWQPHMRLPTERALSHSFGIGRSRVRRVLEEFEQQGRIRRHVGRGTFVCPPTSHTPYAADPVEEVNPENLMEARILIEPEIAALAVRRASITEIEGLRDLVSRGDACRRVADFEQVDHAFHDALTAAAKNTYLAGIMARMKSVRQSGSWSALRRKGLSADRHRVYQQQHDEITRAIEAREADAARDAMRRHLEEVRGNLGL